MNDIFKLLTLFTLTLQSVDIIKKELTPNPPPEISDTPEITGILIDTTGAIEVNKPLLNETVPQVKQDTGIRRIINIPPEIDSSVPDYKGNISLLVEIDGKPCINARVDIFSLTAKIRRPKFAGDNTPIPPYPDVLVKRIETYYTGADGRLEWDMTPGNYMLVALKDSWGGRSDAFSVKNDSKEFTIKMVRI